MTAVFNVQEIQYGDESAFSELLQTFTARIPVLGCRAGFQSGRSSDGSLQNRLATSRPGYLLPRSGGTFEIDVYFCGAGVDTQTGALAHTWLTKLLSDGLGGGDISQVGGVFGAGATTASWASATGTRTRGAVCRGGQKGDSRADGQAFVVGNPVTGSLVALPGTPNAGDLIRAGIMMYPAETLGVTKRFLVGFNSTFANGAQYVFHGCQLSGLTLKIDHMGVPQLTLQYRYAYWREVAGFTIPSAVALADCKAAASAGGSYFLQTVGTTTRALEAATAIELRIMLGLQERTGQGGVAALQNIIGWDRTQCDANLTLSVPWNSTKPTEYDSDGSDSISKHFLATLSAGGGQTANEGRHVGFYLPSIYPIGQRPAYTAWNGLLYQPIVYDCAEGPDTTNDLTRSVFRFYAS